MWEWSPLKGLNFNLQINKHCQCLNFFDISKNFKSFFFFQMLIKTTLVELALKLLEMTQSRKSCSKMKQSREKEDQIVYLTTKTTMKTSFILFKLKVLIKVIYKLSIKPIWSPTLCISETVSYIFPVE